MTTKHPAVFSANVLTAMYEVLHNEWQYKRHSLGGRRLKVLDPMAGIGTIHKLDQRILETIGIELEPEWAEQHDQTITGDALKVLRNRFRRHQVDVVCTSPTYGNRMADHHEAKDGSYRRTYRHVLGRALSANNSGKMQWGEDYKIFHQLLWNECFLSIKNNGLIVVNISDHIRKGEVVPVVDFHAEALKGAGFTLLQTKTVEVRTPRFRYGQNSDARVGNEVLLLGRKKVKEIVIK